MRYTLKEAVEAEGFTLIIDPCPGHHKDALLIKYPNPHAWAQLCQKNVLAVKADSWACVGEAAQEMARAFAMGSKEVDQYAIYLLQKWLNRLDCHQKDLLP